MVLALILAFFFWIFAAICNAIMDTITYHWYKSIFNNSKFKAIWWNPEVSWKNKYVDTDPNKPIRKIIFGLFDRPFTDAWHTFKSLMIVFITLAMVFLAYSCIIYKPLIWHYFILFIIIGTIWNLIFNKFYNHELIK